MIKTVAWLAIVLIPIGTIAYLYYAELADSNPKRVVLCGGAVQGKPEPILQLEEEQCLAIASAVEVVHTDEPDDQALTTFEGQRTPAKIGEPPPTGVRPQALPAEVTAQFPQLRSYRYFREGDKVALVESSDDLVVAFVEVHVGP